MVKHGHLFSCHFAQDCYNMKNAILKRNSQTVALKFKEKRDKKNFLTIQCTSMNKCIVVKSKICNKQTQQLSFIEATVRKAQITPQ